MLLNINILSFKRSKVALTLYLISIKNADANVFSPHLKYICDTFLIGTKAEDLETISNEIFDFYYKIKLDANYAIFDAVFSKHSNFFDNQLKEINLVNLSFENINMYFD